MLRQAQHDSNQGVVALSLPKGAKLLLRPCFDKLSIDMWLVRTTLVTLSLSKGAG